MTADARRLAASEGEGVTGQALGRAGRGAVVGDPSFPGVTLLADGRAGVHEAVALEVVAVAALGLSAADVELVSRCQAVLRPRGGDAVRRNALRPMRPEPDKRHDARGHDHGRCGEAPKDPTG